MFTRTVYMRHTEINKKKNIPVLTNGSAMKRAKILLAANAAMTANINELVTKKSNAHNTIMISRALIAEYKQYRVNVILTQAAPMRFVLACHDRYQYAAPCLPQIANPFREQLYTLYRRFVPFYSLDR